MATARTTALRAVLSRVTERALHSTSNAVTVINVILFVVICALAILLSAWWWLLLVLYVPLVLLATIILKVSRAAAHRSKPNSLTDEQDRLVDAFVDKIEHVLELRDTSWAFFVFLNLKDYALHRDLRTTRNLIANTTSLEKDFRELEQKLQA